MTFQLYTIIIITGSTHEYRVGEINGSQDILQTRHTVLLLRNVDTKQYE